MLPRETYDDAISILVELHRWTLTPGAIAAGYAAVAKVAPETFEQVYSSAISKSGWYKPADFLGELKDQHRQQSATPPALPPCSYHPDAAMWVRFRRHLDYVRKYAGKTHDEQGWPVNLDAHWEAELRSHVSEEEIEQAGIAPPSLVDSIGRAIS